MSTVIPIPDAWKKSARVNAATYHEMYHDSLKNPDKFWYEQACEFAWRATWHTVKQVNFDIRKGPIDIRWFEGGRLNITENCLDRHLPERANQTAFIWEGDDPKESKHITYAELFEQVCKFANVLKNLGVEKGDRVTIYLPMVLEAAVAMLACARIGAVHSVVFAGFSAEALRGRIEDCGSKLIITTNEGKRGGKTIPLKGNVDEALSLIPSPLRGEGKGGGVIKQMVVGSDDYYKQMSAASSECNATIMDAEDPLFILYTSGSTGKPKGVLHTCGGYMVWVGMTFKTTFEHVEGDVFWCSADVGWVTGHSYCVYGPLLNGAVSLLYEGVPNYPDWGRFWQVVDKHQVTILYTAPTAIRAVMREGDEFVKASSRKSLRLLGSVGEPINPEAWLWYYRVVGEERCPVIDTWWQTETGGHMITPFPGATDMKPGAAAWPFFGVKPVIVDQAGIPLDGACEGLLCIADSWPGQARSVFGDHARFEQTYFSQYPGYYFTGDGARRDEDGYYWITGRVDDVLNVSGHRLGTAEIESALVGHAHVTEAAVVGFPHDIKGQGIYCYVTLSHEFPLPLGEGQGEGIIRDLKNHVRQVISPIATPDVIQFTPALPKTRSGKIMRRILRKIAEGETSNLGDVSTLTNPEIVEMLVQGRPALQ